MNYTRPTVATMRGYKAGFQPDPKERYIKLNSNENPYPPSPKVKEALASLSYEDLRLYPDPMSVELREKLGRLYGFSPEEIICGNGSDDILNTIIRTFVEPGEVICFHEPTFPLYRILGIIQSAKVISIPISEPYQNPPFPPKDCKVFFLANPNSPVGFAYSTQEVQNFAENIRGILVVDEAYAEFARENALELVRHFQNVLVVRTVSKSYALAGLRLGYAIGSRNLIREMFKVKDPFNVTRLTQILVSAALEDTIYVTNKINEIISTREWFTQEIRNLGYRVIPSQGNFIFPKPPVGKKGIRFYEKLLEKKVLTRHYDQEGLCDGVRMTIGTPEEMRQVLDIMKNILPEFQL
jgi:histidinol-phosphate aminotransferase